MTKLQPIKNFL